MQAMALLEIETKARVRDREELIHNLSALGCELSAPTRQDDTVYVRKPGDLATFLQNDVFLRIRIQDDGTTVLTAKRPVRKAGDVLVKYEHEVLVSSADEARAMLVLMGFSEAVRVVKVRRKGYVSGYEACLDDIEGLGTFIELEQMGAQEDAERIQAEMRAFLSSLGIAPEDAVTKGYDVLMLESESVR